MKKHIYRVGDQVEIVNPRWIKRVGYKLHWKDVIDQVTGWDEWHAVLKALGCDERNAPFYLQQAVAKLHVEKNRFGGNERVIVYHKLVDDALSFILDEVMPAHGYVGCVALVEAKRVAYTGTRRPSRCWKEPDTPNGPGEYCEESGGLDNSKAHVILRTTYGEIEACDVKLVKEGSR